MVDVGHPLGLCCEQWQKLQPAPVPGAGSEKAVPVAEAAQL